MLDFAVRGAFITAETPEQHRFLIRVAEETAPVAAVLGYPHLSAARADRDGKIAYLTFAEGRGNTEGPFANIVVYPAENKNEKELSGFVSQLFSFSAAAEGRMDRVLKLEEVKNNGLTSAAYSERLVDGKEVHYEAVFRRGSRLLAVTLKPGRDVDHIPGKDKLRNFLPEGKKE